MLRRTVVGLQGRTYLPLGLEVFGRIVHQIRCVALVWQSIDSRHLLVSPLHDLVFIFRLVQRNAVNPKWWLLG
jgi:hypothetical protein